MLDQRLLGLILGAMGALSGCGESSEAAPDAGASGDAGHDRILPSDAAQEGDGATSGCPTVLSVTPVETSCRAPGAAENVRVVCVERPSQEGCEAITNACLLASYHCGLVQRGEEVLCSAQAEGGECCFEISGGCAVGRPFTVGGATRLAALSPGALWAPLPALQAVQAPPALREELGRAHREEARREHASIASFARFALELAQLGAPAALLAAAHRAAREEVEHARVHLTCALAATGVASSPAALDVTGAFDDHTLAGMVLRLVAEGCIGETVAAVIAAAQAGAVVHPTLRAALTRVAREEEAHALLAWRALAWLWPRCDRALRAEVAALFERAEELVGVGASPPPGAHRPEHDSFGHLEHGQRVALARDALTRVVRPAARALLAPPVPRPDRSASLAA